VCDCFAQNDASVKCWGYSWHGELGLGDKITRGDDPFGGCAARRGCLVGSALLSGQGSWLMRTSRVEPLTRGGVLVQRWARTSLPSTSDLG
jgi:hypothetical protein